MSPTAVLEPTTTTAVTARGGPCLRATEFATAGGVRDAETHEGLRLALGLIAEGGWNSEAGRAVLAALGRRARSWAACRAGAPGVVVDPGDVLTAGWSTMASHGSRVAAAEAPWAYVWTSVQNCLGAQLAADFLLSEKTIRWPRHEWPTIVRAGVNTLGVPDQENVDPHLLLEAENATATAVEALVAHIAGGLDSEAVFWAEAVTRAVHVMDRARRSYEEVELRRDPYLRDVLRLSLHELSALAALLIGPRRGDRAAHSLLLALRRDPATSPADVEGARARIRLLRARRHTVSAAVRTAVAA